MDVSHIPVEELRCQGDRETVVGGELVASGLVAVASASGAAFFLGDFQGKTNLYVWYVRKERPFFFFLFHFFSFSRGPLTLRTLAEEKKRIKRVLFSHTKHTDLFFLENRRGKMQHLRLKQQQQALMQQALLQQQSLYHPGILAPPQIEPIPSGNLPPGFDPSTCRSVYVGNIHSQVTEPLLQEVFASTGPVEGCKLIRKEKSSYGFVHYFDRRSAALAILSLNGRHLFGQPVKVNWAYASGQREDTSGHFNIFVGDLSPEVTDAMLYACFSVYHSCSDARVMWDQKTGRSRGFGFVSFRSQQDAQSAINDLSGKWLGSRQIRCNWATKGAGSNDDKQSSDAKSVVELTNGSSEDGKETTNNEAPENNPQYTTVYVGNLAPEVTQLELHCHFHALGAGVIEEVRVQRDKSFGFVRYSTHAGAALAIQMGNTQSFLCGKQIKCSWGSKPTPPGTSSNPLPPPAAAPLPGLSAIDLLAYERQLAMSKMGGVHALMHPQGQHPLKQAAIGVGAAGASQAIYDGGFQNVAAAQQLLYYQ